MDHMHRRERVRAALAGNPVDRPQICGRPAPPLIRWPERLTAIQAEAAARMPVSFRTATRWKEAF